MLCSIGLAILWTNGNAYAQRVDYSVTSVPEESGTDFVQISQNTDYVCMPEVKRTGRGVGWFSNRILDISSDGSQIAYLSFRNLQGVLVIGVSEATTRTLIDNGALVMTADIAKQFEEVLA